MGGDPHAPRPGRFFVAALSCFSLCIAACAEAPPPAPTAAMPPPGVAAAPAPGASPVDGEMLEIARAEEEIDRSLPQGAQQETRGPAGKAADDAGIARAEQKAAPADKGGKLHEAAKDYKAKADEAEAGRAGGGEGCAVACRALASMVASANHLCQLAGENDGRCDDAMARVHGAAARVKSACPGCAVSTAPPPPPPPSPAKDVPAGPAPGMPGSSGTPRIP